MLWHLELQGLDINATCSVPSQIWMAAELIVINQGPTSFCLSLKPQEIKLNKILSFFLTLSTFSGLRYLFFVTSQHSLPPSLNLIHISSHLHRRFEQVFEGSCILVSCSISYACTQRFLVEFSCTISCLTVVNGCSTYTKALFFAYAKDNEMESMRSWSQPYTAVYKCPK